MGIATYISIYLTVYGLKVLPRHPEMSPERRDGVMEYVRRVGEAQEGRINPQNLKIPDAPRLTF